MSAWRIGIAEQIEERNLGLSIQSLERVVSVTSSIREELIGSNPIALTF